MNEPTAEVAKEITSEVCRLEREAERLNQVITVLTERLIPVMHDEYPNDENKEEPARQTPLGKRLDVIVSKVRSSSDALEELTARLEI
jgi:hypothetical protein